MNGNYASSKNSLVSPSSISINVSENKSDDKDDSTQEKHEISFLLATFYTAKSCIGVGVLFIPACFARLGLLGGILVTLLIGYINTWSVLWISDMTLLKQSPNLVTICEMFGGVTFDIAISVIVIIMSLSTLVVYLRLITESISGVFNLQDFKSIILWSSVIIALPIACIRHTRHISWISFASLLGMFYVVIIVIIDWIQNRKHTPPSVVLFKIPNVHFLIASANISYSYACQLWIPQIVMTMNPKSVPKIIWSGMATTSIVYLLMGIFGYLRFGENIQEAIIHAHQSSQTPLTFVVAQLSLAIIYLCSFPLILAPVRLLLSRLRIPRYTIFHVVETVILVVLVGVLAFFIPSATLFISDIVGSIGNAPIAFILPPLMAYKFGLFKARKSAYLSASITILVGITLWISGIWALIQKIIS